MIYDKMSELFDHRLFKNYPDSEKDTDSQGGFEFYEE